MQTIRVFMTADTIGGVWTYALELARALVPWRCEVLLATLGRAPSAAQRQAAAQIPGLTLCESTYKLEWMDDPWDDVDESGDWLLNLARQFRPHVIHLNTYAHGTLPWHAPILMAGHSCVYSWWEAVHGSTPPPAWQSYHRRVQAGLRHADLVVAPTRAMLDALAKHYGPLPPTQLIYNARGSRRFGPKRKEPFILALGRLWDEAKNISLLEQIAPQSDWPIYIGGEQRHPNGKQTDFNQLRPLGKLEQAEVADWMARAAIYALPARYEPFGLTALEAGLSGCALVLGDIPSLREVWGETACFVPPDDAGAMHDTLRDLMRHPRRHEAMGEAARARALRYGPMAMGRAYRQSYEHLLQTIERPIMPAAPAVEVPFIS